MTDTELQEQFSRCKEWNDPDQWDYLAALYFQRGYYLNAQYCFAQADDLRGVTFAEAMPVLVAVQP